MIENDNKQQPEVKTALNNIRSSQWKHIWDRIEWKPAIKSGIVGALAFSIGTGVSHWMNRPDSLVSGMWCVMAAMVVMHANLGGTYNEAIKRFLGIFVGSALGGFWTIALGSSPISLAISIFSTIIICSILNIQESIRIATMSVAVVMILWGLRPEISPWTFALYRIMDSTLGILIAMVVAHTLWPIQITDTIRLDIAHILRRLSELCRLTIKSEPSDKVTDELAEQLVKEINDLLHIVRLSLEEARLELVMEPGKLDEWHSLLNYIEQLFEQMISLQRVNQFNPRIIFDQSLGKGVDHLVNHINNALQTLSNAITAHQETEPLSAMLQSQERLQFELACFRNTHTTRKFNLADVERFFVFFYTLNDIVGTLQQVEQQLSTLKRQLE